MSEDQFTKLFKYMEKRFDGMDKRFGHIDTELRDVRLSINELSGDLKDYHQELVLLARKVDRLERWIQQVAQETGIKLDY